MTARGCYAGPVNNTGRHVGHVDHAGPVDPVLSDPCLPWPESTMPRTVAVMLLSITPATGLSISVLHMFHTLHTVLTPTRKSYRDLMLSRQQPRLDWGKSLKSSG